MDENRVVYNLDPGDGIHSLYEFFVTRNKEDDLRIKGIYSPMDREWTPGTIGEDALRIHDHGNGLKIEFQDRNSKWKSVDLGYDVIGVLSCFLDYYQKECTSLFPHYSDSNRQKILKMRDVEEV